MVPDGHEVCHETAGLTYQPQEYQGTMNKSKVCLTEAGGLVRFDVAKIFLDEVGEA